MPMSTDGVLQAATVIAKTTQTLIGAEINCEGFQFLTLYFAYTKGDETGLKIIPNIRRESGGTAYPYAIQTATGGAITLTDTALTLTASKTSSLTLDVQGISFLYFTQGGSANDGTPTGTLAASYSLKTNTTP